MRVQVEPMPLDTLVELVNGWGAEPRRAGARSDVPLLADHVHRAGVPTTVADRLTDAELIRFADTIFGVVASGGTADRVAASGGTADRVAASGGTADRVAAISALLTRIDVRPDLALVDDDVRPLWLVEARDALLAAALLALRAQLSDEDPERLGICVDGGCADIYIDISPARRRRFCSVQCQNRARAAKFRRTRRTAS